MNPGGNVHPNSPSTGHSHRPCNPSGAIPPFPVESDCFHLAHRPLISYILWPALRSRWNQTVSTWNTYRPCNPLGAIPPFPVESKCVHLARQPLIRTILWPTSVPGGKPTRAAVTVHESGRKRPPQQSFHRAHPPPLQSSRCHPSVPGGIKVHPPGTVCIPATTPDPSLRSRWNQSAYT